MGAFSSSGTAHPEGESLERAFGERGSWPVDTPGGRFHAEWDEQSAVTREGQLIFFFQFLHAGGRWSEFLRGCPLRYVGNRGSGALNVMGTALLSVLCGHWRYAHINAVRGDGVNPGLLGMDRTVSEDAARAAMGRIDESEGLDWPGGRIVGSIEPALSQPWILDIDVTVKTLYGSQEGAEAGYNPAKPGRPCHVYHSCFVAGLRISLGVEARPGKEHAAARGLPGLWATLGRLPRARWPTFARGDCGYAVRVSCLHEGGELVAQAVTLVSKELQSMMSIAERWTEQERWTLLLARLLRPWMGGKRLDGLPSGAEPLLSG